jgi:hypothetical protein
MISRGGAQNANPEVLQQTQTAQPRRFEAGTFLEPTHEIEFRKCDR